MILEVQNILNNNQITFSKGPSKCIKSNSIAFAIIERLVTYNIDTSTKIHHDYPVLITISKHNL